MTYTTARLSHSFNVIYKADEYTPRFGLLVTAMSDPFDKTILSGMSLRGSPDDEKYIRIDAGVFNYNKYIVQTNAYTDLQLPNITPPQPDHLISQQLEVQPGVSFRFLTDEATGDFTVVKSTTFDVEDTLEGRRYITFNFQDYGQLQRLKFNTPSVMIEYANGGIKIQGYNSVDSTRIDEYIQNKIIIKQDTRDLDIDDPEYHLRNKMIIHVVNDEDGILPDIEKSINVGVTPQGDVILYKPDADVNQLRIANGSFAKIFYRQGLAALPGIGLTNIREYGPIHNITYINESTESVNDTGILIDGVIQFNSTINLNSSVQTDVITYDYAMRHRYKWIEIISLEQMYITEMYGLYVNSRQYYGTEFDESHFGMSFTVSGGKSWLYMNTNNDLLDVRFVSFDPVVVDPIDPKIIQEVFSKGVSKINKDYYPVYDDDFDYPDYTNIDDNDDFVDLYYSIEQAIEGLELDPGYLVAVVGPEILNELIQQEITTLIPPPMKIAVVFQYYHDSNLIIFQSKDVEDIVEFDCIIGILETKDGINFKIKYRDPVYQRMIPYAEWDDHIPSDLVLNNAQLYLAANKLNTQIDNSPTEDELIVGDYDSDANNPAIVGSTQTYNFVELSSKLIPKCVETSVKLYSTSYLEGQMLMYDFDYVYVIDQFMKNYSKKFDTDGLIYDDTIYLTRGQYAQFYARLPANVERFMIVPIFSNDVTATKYTVTINHKPTIPLIELSGEYQDLTNATIKFECNDIEKNEMLILGFGVLYDLKDSKPNPLRVNNMMNRIPPYFDYHQIDYDQSITIDQLDELKFIEVEITYGLHLDDPINDEAHVDIYAYDKFITRFFEIAKHKYKIKINTSLIELYPEYDNGNYYIVPIVFRAYNKYGSTYKTHQLLISKTSSCIIKIRDIKYILVSIDDVEDADGTIIKMYNYAFFISTKTCDRYDLNLTITKDKDDESKGKVFYAVSNDPLTEFNLTVPEDDLPRTVMFELQSFDRSQYFVEYVTLESNN